MKKFLIIQTAFIGDVILATPVIEKLHACFPDAAIDFLLRKGNESLFENHPFLNEVLVWDKRSGKYKNMHEITHKIRNAHYDYAINLQRFASTGMITAFSKAQCKVGFDKNPYSFFFSKKIKHIIGTPQNPKHEAERNLDTIKFLTDDAFVKPKLYPSAKDFEATAKYKDTDYICIAPASVWFTKQFPPEKWTEFIGKLAGSPKVYLIGGKEDAEKCEQLRVNNNNVNLAGKLTLLETAALMKDAKMNFVNDSAPLHLASAVNAPVAAVFCSTVPAFGFGPLSEKSVVIETKEPLACKPCGLHGLKACPEKHFKCATTIDTDILLSLLND